MRVAVCIDEYDDWGGGGGGGGKNNGISIRTRCRGGIVWGGGGGGEGRGCNVY